MRPWRSARGGELLAVGEAVRRRHQVRPVTPRQQVGTDGLDRLCLLVGTGLQPGEVSPAQPLELPAVGVVQQRKIPQVEGEVVFEELDVLVQPDLVQALLVQEPVDPLVDLHTVGEVGDLMASVADRPHRGVVVDVPEVDAIGDERDAACRRVRLGGEQQVLVVDPDGERQVRLGQERAAVALVGRQGVEGQQVRDLTYRIEGPRGAVEPRVPLGLLAVA